MNDNTENVFVRHALEILKRSVLLELYERNKEASYGHQRYLNPADFSKHLGISPPKVTSSDRHALFYGTLDHLREDKLVCHTLGIGWIITEKGIAVIEGHNRM